MTGRGNMQSITEDSPPGGSHAIGGTTVALGDLPANLRLPTQDRDQMCRVPTSISHGEPRLTSAGLITTVRCGNQAAQ
jgi:hypothetical protein